MAHLPEIGARFKVARLDNSKGFLVHEKFIENRRLGAVGTFQGFAAGSGGDVWYLVHRDGVLAAYLCSELEMFDGKE